MLSEYVCKQNTCNNIDIKLDSPTDCLINKICRLHLHTACTMLQFHTKLEITHDFVIHCNFHLQITLFFLNSHEQAYVYLIVKKKTSSQLRNFSCYKIKVKTKHKLATYSHAYTYTTHEDNELKSAAQCRSDQEITTKILL